MRIIKEGNKDRTVAFVGCLVIILKGNEVLLLKRKNKFDAGTYSLPGGHVDGDEKILEAAIREVKEETNLDLEEKDLEIVSCMHRISEIQEKRLSIEYLVKTEKIDGEVINKEIDKCEELKFFNINNLPDNMSHYAKRGIEAYLNGEHFIEYDK